jgi:hypothetical protein
MNLHDAFMIGALQLAKDQKAYSDLHKSHGIEETHWNLITQKEYWTPDQQRAVRSILANVLEISMTIAGMPPVPLPGQYVAAVIATVVSPCNRMVAAMKAPDSFDAFDASGLIGGEHKDEPDKMKFQQLISLVIAYSAGYRGEPMSQRMEPKIAELVEAENTSERIKLQ